MRRREGHAEVREGVSVLPIWITGVGVEGTEGTEGIDGIEGKVGKVGVEGVEGVGGGGGIGGNEGKEGEEGAEGGRGGKEEVASGAASEGTSEEGASTGVSIVIVCIIVGTKALRIVSMVPASSRGSVERYVPPAGMSGEETKGVPASSS